MELLIALLAEPAIRKVIEDIALEVFVDLTNRKKSDPIFEQKFDAFAVQLSNPSLSPEERSNVLKQLNALRTSP